MFAADFSEHSKAAFGTACSLAGENTKLMVLHVMDPSWVAADPDHFEQQPDQSDAPDPDGAQLEALKQIMREVYFPDRPIDVEYQTRVGNASREILGMAEEMGSDLIVMGTHGCTALRWQLTGSVASAVLRGAQCAVLAQRPNDRALKREAIGVILHPTDFSNGSEVALQVARSLARDRGARLIVLHVAPLVQIMEGRMTAELDLAPFADALEVARQRIDGPDLKYPVESRLCRGPAPEEIVRVADEIGCELIVMGTHGRTGLRRLLMGNTAESVLPEANCPVMIVKDSQRAMASTADRPGKNVMTAL
jgi:nucleotide-binding universal stress UspA family protein